MRTRTATAALLAVGALGIGACGDNNDNAAVDNSVTPATTAAPPTTTAAPATQDAGTTIQKMAISTDLSKKPTIAKPSGDPPTTLYSRDIVKGKGAKAKSGDNVTVQYVGVSYSTGEQFDASWDRGQTFPFQLGAQMVIPGWDQGVAGMRKGGRRMLVIPPDLAYGPQGQGSIGPNETLIFVIDLKKIG